jgi:hypothetical protein
MGNKYKKYIEKIELSPNEWLNWTDERFNDWRRLYDFPRIVDFLYDNLPYFPLWLSEQKGLSEVDLLFHGPARFIRFYGQSVTYIEHDISFNICEQAPTKQIIRYDFLTKKDKRGKYFKAIRSVEFSSYLDWAFLNRNWIFPNKINDLCGLARNLTPSGRTSDTSDYLNSYSNIEFNIPFFMPSISLNELKSLPTVKSPPMLELLKLGGNNETIVDGMIGEKNLEFTNVDNITLISPFITSDQDFIFCTLHNFNLSKGIIHSATFHQCSVDISVKEGSLADCKFEYGESKIKLYNSDFRNISIRERQLNVKLKDTEITSCCFEYHDMFTFSTKAKKKFHDSAKMIFSHLKYPDLAGEHFLIEKKSERRSLWEQFSNVKSKLGVKHRFFSLFSCIWMSLQELYWGYGERPLYIILFSLFSVILLSLFGFFQPNSSTYHDAEKSLIFSFQSLTNISIMSIEQQYEIINLIGSFMSFFGLMSVGLLVAALAAKTKNYN